jgi:two-component system, OmpR family, sensor histidine kinase SenX3
VKFLRKDVEAQDQRLLPAMLVDTLSQIDGEAIVLAHGEVPIFVTPGIEQIGLLKDGKVQSAELLATVRVVRRKHSRQVGQIEIPRGPIGEGRHELTVNVIPLTEDDLVLVLLSDESEAQRVHEVRRDFVANISHELKTPIGALSLLSEAVLGAKNDPEAVEKFATRMQTESKRLTDLVQEIINLSRLQDSDPLSVPSELHVQDLISEAIDQTQVTADSRQIVVSNSNNVDGLILGDREQLIMAIQNIIENAINYSPEGTKVTVTSKVEDGIIDISVTDQGIGIPDTDLDRIFERFYRVDPARSRLTGGTGLGLSIVKHVALKHGGEVKVWSAENVGSTFSLRLPIYSAAAAEESAS